MALRYLAVSFAVYVLPPLVAHAGLLPVDAETAVVMLVVAYRLGGAIHCERVARRRAGEIPAEWFARWYLVAFLGIVLPLGLRMLVVAPFNLQASRDRTSVVSGKSVSVRVTLGVRRLLTQKT